jgi:hypothetical protein
MSFCNGDFDNSVCPIRDLCLKFALVNGERYGVWGGVSAVGRLGIRKNHPPVRGTKDNPDWHWVTEEDALEGLSKEKLLRELRDIEET